jgi:hypothetical protein
MSSNYPSDTSSHRIRIRHCKVGNCFAVRLLSNRLVKDFAHYTINHINTAIFTDRVIFLRSDSLLVTDCSAFIVIPREFATFMELLYSRVPKITKGLAMLYSLHNPVTYSSLYVQTTAIPRLTTN